MCPRVYSVCVCVPVTHPLLGESAAPCLGHSFVPLRLHRGEAFTDFILEGVGGSCGMKDMREDLVSGLTMAPPRNIQS